MKDGESEKILIRIYSHETIVQFQVKTIERMLRKSISFDVTLKGVVSTIEFEASNEEIDLLKTNGGFIVLIQVGDEWMKA